jgi:hypothetical protein
MIERGVAGIMAAPCGPCSLQDELEGWLRGLERGMLALPPLREGGWMETTYSISCIRTNTEQLGKRIGQFLLQSNARSFYRKTDTMLDLLTLSGRCLREFGGCDVQQEYRETGITYLTASPVTQLGRSLLPSPHQNHPILAQNSPL